MATCWLGLYTSMCEYDVNSQPGAAIVCVREQLKGVKSVDRIESAQSQYNNTPIQQSSMILTIFPSILISSSR